MRLFIALDLSPEVLRNLEALLARLRPTAQIKWSPPANLHITTKFIGNWPDERLEELKAELGRLAPRPALTVRVHGAGFFPNARSPRVFWCGVDAPGLDALAGDTDNATAALGIAREDRPYSPHLTLARIKERIEMKPLQDAVAALPSVEFGSFAARSFFLYRSQPGPKGSVYTKLAEFPLSK